MSAVSLAACKGARETEQAKRLEGAGESPIYVATLAFNSKKGKLSWLEYKKMLTNESSLGDMSRCKVPENIWN